MIYIYIYIEINVYIMAMVQNEGAKQIPKNTRHIERFLGHERGSPWRFINFEATYIRYT